MLAAGWAGLIFWMSSRSAMPIKQPFDNFDKLVHAVEYGTLCILLARALHPGRMSRIPAVVWSLAILASFIYGITDEMHQAFVPNRSCDPFDAAFDLFGAGLTALGASRLLKTRVFRGI